MGVHYSVEKHRLTQLEKSGAGSPKYNEHSLSSELESFRKIFETDQLKGTNDFPVAKLSSDLLDQQEREALKLKKVMVAQINDGMTTDAGAEPANENSMLRKERVVWAFTPTVLVGQDWNMYELSRDAVSSTEEKWAPDRQTFRRSSFPTHGSTTSSLKEQTGKHSHKHSQIEESAKSIKKIPQSSTRDTLVEKKGLHVGDIQEEEDSECEESKDDALTECSDMQHIVKSEPKECVDCETTLLPKSLELTEVKIVSLEKRGIHESVQSGVALTEVKSTELNLPFSSDRGVDETNESTSNNSSRIKMFWLCCFIRDKPNIYSQTKSNTPDPIGKSNSNQKLISIIDSLFPCTCTRRSQHASNQVDMFSCNRLHQLIHELSQFVDQLEKSKKIRFVSLLEQDDAVEALRQISEVIVYGEQHGMSHLDIFCQNDVMGKVYVIVKSNCLNTVKTQVLQTLGIMVMNITDKFSILKIFSQPPLNKLIMHKFDFSDEEITAHYISFLKALSFKLDTENVVHLLVGNDFPLYTEAVKFFQHEESMIRNAVRTITLNVFKGTPFLFYFCLIIIVVVVDL